MKLVSESAKRVGFLGVIVSTLTSAAPAAGDGARRADEPPAGLSAADWTGIRTAHDAAWQTDFAAQGGFTTGIDPIEQQAYLKASNTGANDVFGVSVAASGDTVVVGASQEDSNATMINGDQSNNSASNAGAAYVFVRGPGAPGAWSQQAYLKATNTNLGDQFGWSVAVSGDTVVVGARFEDSSSTGINGDQANNSASEAGAAYVFVRSGGVWSQQAYLKASNTDPFDWFGWSVAVSGDTVVVGALQEDSNATGIDGNQDNNSLSNAGAAYVFVRSDGGWSQQAYLKAFNSGAGIEFGDAVAVSGETVVVGASIVRVAYVFVRSGDVWNQQAYLTASNTGVNDEFGSSVAVSGDTVVVGARFEDSSATGINGDQTNNTATDAGAAYVFVRSGSVWSQQAYLKASNTGTADLFGFSVAVSGDTVVVGARDEDSSAVGINGDQANNGAANAGAAYVFVRSGGVWSQQAYLKASNTGAGDFFGWAVAVSGDTVVLGALVEASSASGINGDHANNGASGAGAAYVFALGAPPAPLGDMNCDGVVTVSDIGGFVLALTDPAGYAAAFPDCDIENGDINNDGAVTVSDIGPFVALLTGG